MSTEPATSYYTSRYSGEQIDQLLTGLSVEIGGSYANLAAIQAAFPNGDTAKYQAQDTGIVYTWNSNTNAWDPLGTIQGPIGPQGETGKSAYQYAVDGGYTGTESQFKAMMSSVDTKATEAINSAAAASNSKTAAAQSAATAVSSATAAANSADSAGQSKTAAADSAASAASSASSAASSATASFGSAAAAEASKTAAAGSAEAAAGSAASAAESASAAGNNATAAAGSATAAEASKTAADQSAQAAAGSASAAAGSATSASASAQTAQQYSGKPPIIQGGTWWTWNATQQAYTDTGEAAQGNLMYATFYVDASTGDLYMVTDDEYTGPGFRLVDGDLEAILSYG